MARPLPLFAWRDRTTAAGIAAERAQLVERIGRLPPMSHRRVELTTRLKLLTVEELKLKANPGARP
jgi:hypothetical protein